MVLILLKKNKIHFNKEYITVTGPLGKLKYKVHSHIYILTKVSLYIKKNEH